MWASHKRSIENPKRIISLVPSQTELLYYLGLHEETVGITKFCVHPSDWLKHKKRIGGTKNPNLDLIRELKPDLIIANKEENNKGDVEILATDFPVWFTDVKNVNDTLDLFFGRNSKVIITRTKIKDFNNERIMGNNRKMVYS